MSGTVTAAVHLDSTAVLSMNLNGFKLVEASAGTGKTYAIGNLYLRMLMDGHKVGGILVVTFTNAATEELRGRIRMRIHDALERINALKPDEANMDDDFLNAWRDAFNNDPVAKDLAIRQLKVALNSMDEAAIYTIHGFCQRALTEHAFSSRQTFDVEMLADDGDLWDAAIKDWWRIHAYPLDVIALHLFTSALVSVESLIQLQSALRKPRVTLLPETDATTGELLEQWRKHAEQWVGLVESWKSDQDKIVEALNSGALIQRRRVYKRVNLPIVLEKVAACLDAGPTLTIPVELNAMQFSELKSQLKKGQSEGPFGLRFFRLVDEYLEPLDGLKKRFRVAALAEAHQAASHKVSSNKRAAGTLSFNDQLLFLQQALADNHELGMQINHQFPIAMIDEFQDTDAIQYEIFRHIYHGRDQAGLIMIGDPKQAIYSFRGGDIFTYIQAKQDAPDHYTLATNWRSTPRLIEAINKVFSNRGDKTFIYEDIPFAPVIPAEKQHELLYQDGSEVVPVTIWHIENDNAAKARPKNDFAPLIYAHTANEVARLIQSGRDGALKLGEKNVHPGDIAVLVRTHFEANELKNALRQCGVNAVANGSEQVFSSDEASGLQSLLEAVVEFRSAHALRRALASSLLNYHYSEIYSCISDEQQWLEWAEHFRELNALWVAKGFMAMFQQMLRLLKFGNRMAGRHDASRRLTNLLHLGELTQQASKSVIGMDAMSHWFGSQMNQESSEAELRLENDGDLVRIVTIHSSKGLEYPIVFLPFMWSCRSRESYTKTLLPFFDETEQVHCLDAEPTDGHLLLAEKERLAEDIRLAYVALTRARAKIYLAWGNVGDASKAALGWLFHKSQQPDDLSVSLPCAINDSTNVKEELMALADSGHIEVIPLPSDANAIAIDQSNDEKQLCQAAQFSGSIATDWRISSFSSMTRDVHQVFSKRSHVISDDFVFNIQAGSQTGLFLHSLFEKLDFQQGGSDAVRRFTEAQAARYGLDVDIAPVIDAWVADVLATHLDEAGISLGELPPERRLNELQFDFSVNRVDIGLLNRTLETAAGRSLQPLQISDCRGFITGIIDLVFEANGRFYLADYKSNHLGCFLDEYTQEKLAQAVYDRRYDLQYLIYSLALHRYLKLRMPDYDYESHFGGVYYLFLRGMRASHGNRYGVYYAKPDHSLIERLDQQVFNAEVCL